MSARSNEPKGGKELRPEKGTNKFWQVVKMVAKWMYQLRSVLLAIPVAAIALGLAGKNMSRLPGTVGFFLQKNGEFQFLVTRSVAVMGPLAITAVCLLLMFCSRKVVFPWLISVFSLVIPWIIWITNMFAV